MHKQFKDRLYDRLAALAADDGGRLMGELNRLSAAERQKIFRDRRVAAGQTRALIWLNPAQSEALKLRFPGPRGGISWGAVIDAAMARGRGET